MKKLLLYTFALLAAWACQPQEKPTTFSSGLSDIDLIINDLATKHSDSTNFDSRRAALFRWWRLLWRQGIDLDAFDGIAETLVNQVRSKEQDYLLLDSGYFLLKSIAQNPTKIEEIPSQLVSKGNTSKTNWSRFNGTEKEQRGYSPDQGPTKGKIAWKFPKSYYWNAEPVVQNGKIYTSTPGIDVVGLCIDEKTGNTVWRGRQNGIHFYGEHCSRWSPVVTENYVSIRTAYEPTSIKVFDKVSGASVADAEAVSTPYAYVRNGKTLVLADPATQHDIWAITTDTYIAGQPIATKEGVFVVYRNGDVSKFPLDSKEASWSIQLDQRVGGTPTLIDEVLYVGTEAGKIHALNSLTGASNWVFETDQLEPRTNQMFSQVLQQNDKLYVGSANKNLYCLSAKSGEALWQKELSDWVRAKPVILNNTLFAATLDSKLYAFDLSKEAPSVKFTTSLGEHGIQANLVIGTNSVIAIGRDLMMYAVAPADGSIQWSRGIVDGAWVDGTYYFADWNGGLLGSPTVVDDVAYIGGPDGFVNAVNVETGEEIWKFETNSTASISPTVVGDKVFFGYLGATTEHYGYDNPGQYWAVNKDTGEPVWTTFDYARVWVGAAYNDGVLFFGNTDGHVFGVNPDNGEMLWTYWTGKDTPKENVPKDTPFKHGYPMGVYCVPTADDNYFYTGSWAGYYFAFEQKTGKIKWRCSTMHNEWGGLPDSAAPTIYNGYLYVQKKGGLMAAINIETGELAWEWQAPRGHLYNATPAAHEGLVYGSDVRQVVLLPYTGKMVAFNEVDKGGDLVWQQEDMGGLTAPAVVDGQLISGASNSMYITSVDPKTGEILWRTWTGGEMLENLPAIYGDKFLAVCKNGYLYAIE